MNSILFTDEGFINTESYKRFIMDNPGIGRLKIHAYAASEALPVAGLRIVVSKNIDDLKVIFFDGYTDSSGMIEKLSLPTPKLNLNNLDVPLSTVYEIEAFFPNELNKHVYSVNMYDDVCVLQNINYIPGGKYGN